MDPKQQSELIVEQDRALAPTCPYCESGISNIRARALPVRGEAPFGFGKRYVYACPDCNKLLAITHRKGFWMG